MKSTMRKLTSQLGLAMDEAILAGVMVASFGAFVAVNVPWSSVLGSGSAQIVDEMQQIERANAQFFAKHRLWPHQTTDGDWKHNIAALVSPEAMRYPYSIMTQFKNFLPEYNSNATQLSHSLGDGGMIMQRPISYERSDYLEIIYERVPLADARKIDVAVDGAYDPEEGKVYFVYDEDEGFVNIHYRANLIVG